jgi:hypothetical protein
MQKHKKKIQKKELEEEESQKTLIINESIKDIAETLDFAWGSEFVVITTTIRYKMIEAIKQVLPLYNMNRSQALQYVLHQGIARLKEIYARENTL